MSMIETGDAQRAAARRDRTHRFEAWVSEALAIAGRAGLDVDQDDWVDCFDQDLTPAEAAAYLVGDEWTSE